MLPPTRVFDARFNTFDYENLKQKLVVASDGERNEIVAPCVGCELEAGNPLLIPEPHRSRVGGGAGEDVLVVTGSGYGSSVLT